jgi:transposase
LLGELRREMQYLHGQIQQSDKLMERIACDLEQCKRLMAIPGIGPTIATATVAAIGNGASFQKGLATTGQNPPSRRYDREVQR